MTDRTDKQTFVNKQPVFFSDFLTNFNKHPSTGNLGKVTNSNSIKQAIMNLVQTNYGERLYQPSVGGNITQMLFEPISNFSATMIEESIKTTIFNNDTRVASVGARAIADPLNNAYNVTIVFIAKNSNTEETIDLVLTRNR